MIDELDERIKTVKASKVRSDCQDGEGDMIPGLDNAYVYDLGEDDREGYVSFTLHTAEGDEAYLTCPSDMPIAIERR